MDDILPEPPRLEVAKRSSRRICGSDEKNTVGIEQILSFEEFVEYINRIEVTINHKDREKEENCQFYKCTGKLLISGGTMIDLKESKVSRFTPLINRLEAKMCNRF